MPDKISQQLGPGVAVWEALRFEDFVGELGAGFEGEGFGEDERVVAVEEDLFDLWGRRRGVSGGRVEEGGR